MRAKQANRAQQNTIVLITMASPITKNPEKIAPVRKEMRMTSSDNYCSKREK
jgi:hypothetical protein